MSAVAQPRARSFLAIGSFVIILGAFVAVIAVVQQALVASVPSGYQVGIVNLARQIGLAPPQPTFGEPAAGDASYGFGFAGRSGAGAGGFGGGGGGQLAVAAKTIGISMDQLRAELATASLAQVAQTHGADPSAVAAAMKAAGDAQVDTAVGNGRLTAEEAAERKAQVDQRVDQLMTQVGGPSGARPRGAQP
jgi:hypothetical protein